MLSGLDESLWHQAPLPFAFSALSDHRFFDRLLLGAFHPDGRAALVTGIGYYKNMNVADGFVMAQIDSSKQYNLRFSQALDRHAADVDTRIGPLKSRVVQPFQEIHVSLERGDYPLAFDLQFRNVLPPRLENPHTGRLDGREHTNYQRFHQLGAVDGWVEIDGARIAAENWFCWRDHSWGLRPGVGGFEPQTGTATGGGVPSAHRTGGRGLLLLHAGFWNGRQGGGIQILEDGFGTRIYIDGEVHPDGPDGAAVSVSRIDHDIRFKPGTRIYERLDLELGLANGDVWTINIEPMGRPLVYRGAGYDSGFDDGRGLGAWRGADLLIEQDIYDISAPEAVVRPNGETIRPQHREQFARATINGVAGYAYTPFFVIGAHPRFGISA